MYQLLDLRTCKHRVDVTSNVPMALVDCEKVLIAVVSKSGDLIYHNRAFMKAYQVQIAKSGGLNLQDALPELWHRLSDRRIEQRHDPVKVIDLYSEPLSNAIGHLLVSFQKRSQDQGPVDFQAVISENEHPLFMNYYSGFYVADPQAFTVKVNPAYEKITFLPENDLVGRNLLECKRRVFFRGASPCASLKS